MNDIFPKGVVTPMWVPYNSLATFNVRHISHLEEFYNDVREAVS